MTESCAAATLNTPGAVRFGSVGRALPGTDAAIAQDGEVLLRGPHVFAGYHRDPEATGETIRDGWLHTGDLGALDADGFLTITGRKKDLIITSNGENVSPSNIESMLRETRWISQAVVHGDRRPYLVAVLTLDHDEAPKLAEKLGIALPQAGLRAMVPVNVRVAAEHLALGNRLSSLFVHLPVAEENPILRYAKVRDDAEGLPAGDQALAGSTIVRLVGVAPPVLHAFLARSLFSTRLFNVTVTNVPGPQTTL